MIADSNSKLWALCKWNISEALQKQTKQRKRKGKKKRRTAQIQAEYRRNGEKKTSK